MDALDLLDAEYVGFDPMDLVKALPGVLQQTGQALQPGAKGPAAAPAPAMVVAPAPADSSGSWWKIGAGILAGAVVVLLLKR